MDKKIFKNNTKNIYDCHLVPQYNYIFDNEGNKKIKHVLRLDSNLNKNLKKLLEKYNINMDINDFEEKIK